MARPQALDYEDRKRAILKNAAILFAKKGYSETLLEDIAEISGIKKSSLYHYHRSKHAILHGLIAWKIEDLAWKVEAATEALRAPEQQLRALIATLVKEYIRVPEEITVLLTQTRYLTKPALRSVGEIQERIIRRAVVIIQDLRPDQEISRHKLKALSMMLFGMTNWIHVWFKPNGQMDADTLVDMILQIFLKGIDGLYPDFLN